MKVAFLSDVHANFPALCAALDAAERAGAGTVVAAGDMIGSGPHPVEVVRLLMQRQVRAIRGNVERKVLALGGGRKVRRLLARPRAGHLAWTALQLGERERSWLERLPGRLELDLAGVPVRVVHGSARSDTEYIYPSVTRHVLPALAGEPRPAVLVCGHSHIPFSRRVGGVQVVNCGSVGRPVDGDPRGSLAVLDFGASPRVRVALLRFAYPVADTVRDLEARGVPGAIGAELERGVKRKGV